MLPVLSKPRAARLPARLRIWRNGRSSLLSLLTRHADRLTAPRSRSLRSGHRLPGVILTGSRVTSRQIRLTKFERGTLELQSRHQFSEPRKEQRKVKVPRFRTIIGLISGPAIIASGLARRPRSGFIRLTSTPAMSSGPDTPGPAAFWSAMSRHLGWSGSCSLSPR